MNNTTYIIKVIQSDKNFLDAVRGLYEGACWHTEKQRFRWISTTTVKKISNENATVKYNNARKVTIK